MIWLDYVPRFRFEIGLVFVVELLLPTVFSVYKVDCLNMPIWSNFGIVLCSLYDSHEVGRCVVYHVIDGLEKPLRQDG